MKRGILKLITVLFVLLLVCSANTFSQPTSPKTSGTKLTKKVLIVLSAADNWKRKDGSDYPTGYWAEEFIVVHDKFVQEGFTVELATPGGQKPTADPKSLDPKVAPDAPRYVQYLKSIAKDLDHPLALSNVKVSNYDAIIIPGGHGPVVDLYKDKDMGKVLFAADKADKIIGAVCHGQAALLSAMDVKGNWLFKGRTLTAFSDEEEIEFGTADNAPWLLAATLRKCGANYKRGEKNWGDYVVRDRNLISGQNPASSLPMAVAIIEELNKKQ